MSDPATPGDGEHDAWLREALRHAPDASVAAPAKVRDAILSQARAAAAVPAWPGASRGVARDATPWAALWSWLARPPVAAGFASVMAVTLVGLMWWDRPMDEALPQPPQTTVASRDAPRQAPAAPAPAPALAQATAPATAPAAIAPPAVVAANAVPARPLAAAEPSPRRQAVAAAPFEAKEEQRVAQRAAGTSRSGSSLVDSAAKKKRPAENPEASVSTDKLAAAIDKDQAASRAERERDTAVAKNDATAGPFVAQAPAAAGTMAKAARPFPAAPSPSPPAAPQAFADARGGPADDALSRWLADVEAAAAGRWQRVDTQALRRDDPAALSSAASRGGVRLQAAGRPAGVLRIDGTVLRFESLGETPPQIWQAELPAAVAERLRATMPRQPP